MKRKDQTKLLAILIGSALISIVILGIEILGSQISGSLALLADAGHIASDIFAHAISLLAILYSSRKPNKSYPYGYYRVEVIAALLNGFLLILVSLWILWESIDRAIQQTPIETESMLLYSILGLVLNLISALLLFRFSHANLNIKSTYYHVLSDLLGTVAVVLGALLIQSTGLVWIDLLLGFLLGIFVFRVSFQVIQESLQILLEKNPTDFEKEHLIRLLLEISGIYSIPILKVRKLTSQVFATELVCIVKRNAKRDEILLAVHKVQESFQVFFSSVELIEENTYKALSEFVIPERSLEPHSHHRHDDGHHHSHSYSSL